MIRRRLASASHPPHGLLLDLDGTLVDSVYAQVVAWQQALAEQGVTMSAYVIHSLVGCGPAQAAATLSLQTGVDLYPVLHRAAKGHLRFLATLIGDLLPCPGARELLATAGDAEIPLAIVTGASAPVAELLLSVLAAERPHQVVSPGDGLRSKPWPDTLRAAAKRLDVSVDQCWAIGDTVSDVLAARRSPTDAAIAVLTGGTPRAALVQAGATDVCDDLIAVVQQLRQAISVGS